MKKYQSIENHYKQATIEYYRENGLTNGQWYATEKVHGANFSIISDGETVEYASRTGILTEGFFDHTNTVGDLPEKVKQIAKHYREPVQVYFEYYGGAIVNAKSGKIQYDEDDQKRFIALDILLKNSDKFVAYPENFNLFERLEIRHVPIIATGTFDEMLVLSSDFNSLVASIPNTKSEGFVMKPYENTVLSDGNRVLMKNVAEAFKENKATAHIVKVEDKKDYTEDIKNYATDIRLGKVAAKFGIESGHKAKFGVLIQEFAKDISEESGIPDINQIKAACKDLVKAFFN